MVEPAEVKWPSEESKDAVGWIMDLARLAEAQANLLEYYQRNERPPQPFVRLVKELQDRQGMKP